MSWEAKARRREAKRERRAEPHPVHGSSVRAQAPRPLSKKLQAKLRRKARDR